MTMNYVCLSVDESRRGRRLPCCLSMPLECRGYLPPSPLLSATGSSSTNAVLAFDFVCVSVDKSRRGHRLPCRLEDLSHFD